MLKLAVLINTFCIGLSIALIYFPSAAIWAMCKESNQSFFQPMVIEVLAPHLIGPSTALTTAILLRVFLARGLQIPRWLVAIGALGAIYSVTALQGGYAHDFSHYLCDDCTGYGGIITTIAASAAILLALTHLVQTRHIESSTGSFFIGS